MMESGAFNVITVKSNLVQDIIKILMRARSTGSKKLQQKVTKILCNMLLIWSQ